MKDEASCMLHMDCCHQIKEITLKRGNIVNNIEIRVATDGAYTHRGTRREMRRVVRRLY